jgi:hypothetical protein
MSWKESKAGKRGQTQFSCPGRYVTGASGDGSSLDFVEIPPSPPRSSCDRCSSKPRRLRLPETAEQSQAEKRGAEQGHGRGLRHGPSDTFYHGDIVQTI